MPSPRYWRELPNRFRLEASRCKGCGKVSFPSRPVCPACRRREFEGMTLSWNGRVVTSTVVQVPPTEFQMEAPFAVAIVETPEGARLMTQVVDCDPAEVLPGMEVRLMFRRIRKEGSSGILCYGFKGVPAS
jgi:uncharacterized OB-fold protein